MPVMRRRALGLIVFLASLWAAPATAQTPEPLALAGATVLDPGTGDVTIGATVLVANGRIEAIQPSGAAPPDGYRAIDLGGRYLVPGLIDAHVHIADFAAARRALASGVTTARSMGVSHFVDVGLRALAATGDIDSPEILAAGYHVRPQPTEAVFVDAPELADLIEKGVHSPDAMARMARLMASRNVDWIKVVATDRAGLPTTDPRRPLYDAATLEALVEEAAAAGLPVAAHAHGDEGGRAAVVAGVRSIEHGTYLSGETLALMVERGTYLVPTISVVADMTIPGGDYDSAVLQVRGRHMLPRVRRTAAEAHRQGVRIVAATDTGYSDRGVVRLSHELIELVGVGLSELDAIRAATSVAAEMLEIADRVGRIAVGYEADLIVLDADPLEAIGAYQDVLLVVVDGRVAINRLEW